MEPIRSVNGTIDGPCTGKQTTDARTRTVVVSHTVTVALIVAWQGAHLKGDIHWRYSRSRRLTREALALLLRLENGIWILSHPEPTYQYQSVGVPCLVTSSTLDPKGYTKQKRKEEAHKIQSSFCSSRPVSFTDISWAPNIFKLLSLK